MYKLTTAATITSLFIVPGLSAPVFNAASGVERLERREYGYGGYGGGGYAAVPEVYVPAAPAPFAPASYYAPPPPPPSVYAVPMMSPYSQGMQGYPQPGGMQQKPNAPNGGQGAQHPHDHPRHPSQLSQDHPHHPSQLSQDHLPHHERHSSLAGGASQLSHQHQHHSSFASSSELSQTLGAHEGTGHHSHAGDLAMPRYPDHHGHAHDHLSATASGLNGLPGAQHHGQHAHDPQHPSQQLGLSSQQQPGLPGQQQHHHQQQHALHPGQHHAPTDHTYPGSSPAGDLAYGSHNHGPHVPLAPLSAHLTPHPHGSATHPHPQSQTHYRRSLDFMD